MTTITSAAYYAANTRYAGASRASAPSDGSPFAGQQKMASPVGKAESDKLADLLVQRKELQQQQVKMTIRDYIVAMFTLGEQIATEGLNEGEELERVGVRFEGRIYNLAFGKRLDVTALAKKTPDEGMRPLYRPEELGSEDSRSRLMRSQSRVDIKA